MEEYFIVYTDDGKQDAYSNPLTLEFELKMGDKFLIVKRITGNREEVLAMYYADKIKCIVKDRL